MSSLPPLLSIAQAAEMIGMKSSTLRGWRKRFQRGVTLREDVRLFVSRWKKIGTAIRIPAEAITDFLGNSGAGGSPSLVGGEIGQAMLKVQQEILDELRLIRLERNLEEGEDYKQSLEATWRKWIAEKVSPPVYHFTFAPKTPTSESVLKDRFQGLLRYIAADNGGQVPKSFSVIEKGEQADGEHRIHLHALAGGIPNMKVNLDKFASHRELTCRKLGPDSDGGLDYVSRKAARGSISYTSGRRRKSRKLTRGRLVNLDRAEEHHSAP